MPSSSTRSGTEIGSTLPRAVLQWNEFGATVGGPIIKDKLFFFADFQGMINNTPATPQTNTVIPSAYLTGNLREPLHQPGSHIRQWYLYEPRSSALHARLRRCSWHPDALC